MYRLKGTEREEESACKRMLKLWDFPHFSPKRCLALSQVCGEFFRSWVLMGDHGHAVCAYIQEIVSREC